MSICISYSLKSYRNSDRLPEAEGSLEKALHLYPNHFPSLIEYSSLKIANKEFDDAIASVQRIIDLNPYYRDALYQKAYIKQLMRTDAESAYEDVIRYYPDDLDAGINLSFINFSNGERDKAIGRLKGLYKVYPQSDKVLANLSRYLITNGRKIEAAPYVRSLKQLHPNSPFNQALDQMMRR